MLINLNTTLNNLIIKNQSNLEFPLDTINKKETLDLASHKDNMVTLIIDKEKPLLKLPLEDVLKELGVKVSKENIAVLQKLIENKVTISKDKFNLYSKLLKDFPQHKQEILELLFNPLLRLFLLSDSGAEKAFLYLKEDKPKKSLEFTIFYQHPQTDDILIKIFWGNNPTINMYFTKEETKKVFVSQLDQLRKQLTTKCIINCFHQEIVTPPPNKTGYFKIDITI